LCSDVLLWILMKNGIQELSLTWERLNVLEWVPFFWPWAMFTPQLLKAVFS
jgi:hypothetical protein